MSQRNHWPASGPYGSGFPFQWTRAQWSEGTANTICPRCIRLSAGLSRAIASSPRSRLSVLSKGCGPGSRSRAARGQAVEEPFDPWGRVSESAQHRSSSSLPQAWWDSAPARGPWHLTHSGWPVPLRRRVPRADWTAIGSAHTFPATSSKATALRKRPAAANRTCAFPVRPGSIICESMI